MDKLLSILIPTRNRRFHLERTLNQLRSIFPDENLVEIIVSDNSDENLEKNEEGSDEIFIRNRVLRVVPDIKFETAEENLFSILPLATGKYIWPIGDDDIIIRSTAIKLLQECENEDADVYIYNNRAISTINKILSYSRIYSETETHFLPYSDFVARTGLWSFSACIGLTVFKKSLLDFSKLGKLLNLESKIYLHVFYMLWIFKNARTKFNNYDLIWSRRNDYAVPTEAYNHWNDYATKIGKFGKYPWTVGLLENYSYIVDENVLPSEWISQVIETGDLGHRVPLIELMLTQFIEQFENEIWFDLYSRKSTKSSQVTPRRMHDAEILYVINFFRAFLPLSTSLCDLLIKYPNYQNFSRKDRIVFSQNLKNQRQIFESNDKEFPFSRFFYGVYFANYVYVTNHGYVAITQQYPGQPPSSIQMVNAVDVALQGLQIPQAFIHAANFEELLTQLEGKSQMSQDFSTLENINFDEQHIVGNASKATTIETLPGRVLLRLYMKILWHKYLPELFRKPLKFLISKFA